MAGCANLSTPGHVLLLIQGREHHYPGNRRRGLGLDALQQIKAIVAGQIAVHNGQGHISIIRGMAPERFNRLLGVGSQYWLHAPAGNHLAKVVQVGLVVVYQ